MHTVKCGLETDEQMEKRKKLRMKETEKVDERQKLKLKKPKQVASRLPKKFCHYKL